MKLFGKDVTTDPPDEYDDELYEPFFCARMVELVTRIRNTCDYLLETVDNEYLHPETPIENIFEWASELVDFCIDDED